MKILYQLTRYAPLSFSLTPKYDIHDINIMQTSYENQVMRIKKNISYGMTNWSNTKFSKLT